MMLAWVEKIGSVTKRKLKRVEQEKGIKEEN